MVDKVVAEIKGTARVIAGDDETFSGVRYRISVVDLQGRRSLLQGTIEAEPSVLSALVKLGQAAIDLGELSPRSARSLRSGLLRLRARKSSHLSADRGDSWLDCVADQRGHANSKTENG